MATLDAYWSTWSTTDSAAKVVVRYMRSTGRNVAALLDPPLRDAVTREMTRHQSQ